MMESQARLPLPPVRTHALLLLMTSGIIHYLVLEIQYLLGCSLIKVRGRDKARSHAGS